MKVLKKRFVSTKYQQQAKDLPMEGGGHKGVREKI